VTTTADILEIVRTDENGAVLRLCVGGEEVKVTTFWAGDPDGEGIHREWQGDRTLTDDERDAVARLLVYTGLMA
jgi:hypothetical protein